MVQIKPQDTDRFLAKPHPAHRVVLIYGSDTGLVAERAAAFAKAVLAGSDDPFALVRLDSAEIAADTGRLADEANTIALFGGNRAIWIKISGNRPIQNAVEAVLAAPPTDSWIILEAGDLKKGTGLRKLCENAPGAAAIACYADNAAALDRLIESELQAAGLSIEADAKDALRNLLGSDRLASRGEIAKLALYAHGSSSVTLENVRAIVGDAGTSAVDEMVDAAALGDSQAFDQDFRRQIAAGTAPFVVANAALRHFQLLHRLRGIVDRGVPAKSVVDGVPGLFFQRKARVEQALRLWTSDRLAIALERIDRAILESRLQAAIGSEIVGQVLLSIAVQARQAKSGRR